MATVIWFTATTLRDIADRVDAYAVLMRGDAEGTITSDFNGMALTYELEFGDHGQPVARFTIGEDDQ